MLVQNKNFVRNLKVEQRAVDCFVTFLSFKYKSCRFHTLQHVAKPYVNSPFTNDPNFTKTQPTIFVFPIRYIGRLDCSVHE